MRLPDPTSPRFVRNCHYLALGLTALLVSGLYVPFLDNPLVFDDRTLFSGRNFAYYATHPLGLMPRLPGYFSIAATEVLFGSIVAHRVVSLVLHVLCAWVLYRLIYDLLRAAMCATRGPTLPEAATKASVCAFFGAGIFAIHPAAVYGAAYLIQRSIVVATLFGLLSLLLLLHGVSRNDLRFSAAAAVAYALAVLSKEHSLLIAGLALPLVWQVAVSKLVMRRHIGVYLALCAPAAFLVVLMQRQFIGQAYEPDVAAIASQIETSLGGPVSLSWPLSAVTQLGLFFSYLGAWLWPDTGRMAIDLRLDPFANWSPVWIAWKITAFTVFGAVSAILTYRRGRAGMIGLGALVLWIQFLVELSVTRFQEPFVLYRSYLWAPGLGMAAATLFSLATIRLSLIIFVLASSLLLYGAHDRLMTFTSPLRLWEDAAKKLPDDPIPWGSRVFYQLGREYLYSGQPERAMATARRCLAIYPDTPHCVYALGAIHLQMGENRDALSWLIRAEKLVPKDGVTQHRIGLALERLGRMEEALERYRRASALRYRGGDMELGRLGAAVSGDDADTEIGAKP